MKKINWKKVLIKGSYIGFAGPIMGKKLYNKKYDEFGNKRRKK